MSTFGTGNMRPLSTQVGRDRRTDDPRIRQRARVITAQVGGQDYPFALLNLSQRGLSGRCDATLRPGMWIALRFENGTEVRGIVRWTRDELCGVEFGRALGGDWAFGGGSGAQDQRPRAPRYNVMRRATLIIDEGSRACVIRNISEDGMQVECADEIPIGQAVMVQCGTEPAVEGSVRWRRDGRIGVRLSARIDLEGFEMRTASASIGHTPASDVA